MKLTILGSGTCVPSLKRNAPGYLVEANNTNILLDCGSGTLLQLEKLGKSYLDIDLIVLTHTHPDHCADLVPFIQALLVTPKELRKEKIIIAGPPGFHEFLKSAVALFMSWPDSVPLEIIEINGSLNFHGIVIKNCPISHTENSVSYRLESSGKSLVFSGDCGYDEALAQLAEKADLLLIECSFPKSMQFEGHLNSTECGQIAQKANVQQVVLTHFYAIDESIEKRAEECGEIYNGKIIIAEDLMEITL